MEKYLAWQLVEWAAKGSGANDKKISLYGVDYGYELQLSHRNSAESNEFKLDNTVTLDGSGDLKKLSRLLDKAAKTINSNTFKMKDMTKDTVIVDGSATVGKDLHVIRVTGVVKIKDGRPTRVTKLRVHKIKDWTEIKDANTHFIKTGSLSYPKESLIFEMDLPTFSCTNGVFCPDDVANLEEFASAVRMLKDNIGGYTEYRKRVYERQKENGGDEQYSSSSTETNEKVAETTSDDSNDEFPF